MNISDKKVEEQIDLAINNNQKAFSFLLNTFWDKVYEPQFYFFKNMIQAEEITIQTFAKAFEKIVSYSKEYSFLTWLLRISRNLRIDYLRSINTKKNEFSCFTTNSHENLENIEMEWENSIEQTLIKSQDAENISLCIQKLNPQYRKIILLRYFEDNNYKDIAAATNVEIGTLKVKLLRAKRLLAKHLKKDLYI